MIKDTVFNMNRFTNLCRKEMVENWRANVLRIILMYGVMAIILCWNAYFTYKWYALSDMNTHTEDPISRFGVMTFLWFLWGFGCLSASFTMEKMKSKNGRVSVLMTPATPFEQFISRWLISIIVFLVVFLITFKLADYTRILIYTLAYPESTRINPIDLSALIGSSKETVWHLVDSTLKFGTIISGYFFTQSCFILGSSIWPKNSFLKTFSAVVIIAIIYGFVMFGMSKLVLDDGKFYSFGKEVSDDTLFMIWTIAFTFLSLFNWGLAYFRFKESEIIQRM